MRTALLDLDGTLVDAALLITEHTAATLASVGAPAPEPTVLRGLVGPPFETAFPALGLTAEQAAAVITANHASCDPAAVSRTPLHPGVPALLERPNAAGLRLAVATSKPERLARRIEAGVGITRHFALVGGADHVTGRVGKAAAVGSVLDRLGPDPTGDAVIVGGDRHHHVDGAAHGVPTVGVAWGYAGPHELDQARTVVADMDELASSTGRARAGRSARTRRGAGLPRWVAGRAGGRRAPSRSRG